MSRGFSIFIFALLALWIAAKWEAFGLIFNFGGALLAFLIASWFIGRVIMDILFPTRLIKTIEQLERDIRH